jgi:NADPH:quinone reductase-like Zn-dependent oxidoreductase
MTRAALYDRTGGPDVLYIGEVAGPEPGPGQVAVRVEAAGLNPVDAKLRSGFIPSDAPFPRRVGSDLAGTVIAVGEGAVYWDGTEVSIGDEVLGRGPGAVAECTLAQAAELTIRPHGLPVDVAGGLWIAGLTAVSCLATVPIDANDIVLVGGAGGGVGLMAAQLAAATGAHVIGTAAPCAAELLESLGIEAVAYGEGLLDRLPPAGTITAVIDCHGREALDAGVALGVPVDRMVAIAAYGALHELGVHNVERSARTAANLAGLADGIAAGDLMLPVAATFPLHEVGAAFEALESSHAPGKIVILP